MIGKRLVNTGEAAPFDPLQNFETVTYTGNGGTQKITGYIRKGAAFNGSSSSIVTTNNPAVNTTNWTISLWAKAPTQGASFDLGFLWQIGPGLNLHYRETPANTLAFWISDLSQQEAEFYSGVIANEWYNITIVRSGSSFLHYVNGDLVLTRGYTGAITSTDFRLGNRTNGDWPFWGSIDQVRIFNTALNSTQVGQLALETYADPKKSTADYFGDGSGIALYELDDDASDSSIIQITSIATYELDGDATDVSSTYNGTYNGTFVTGKFGQGLDVGSSAPYGLLTGLTLNSNTVTYSMWCNFKDHTANYFSLVSNVGFDVNEFKYQRQSLLWAAQSGFFTQSTGNGVGWTDTNMTPTPSNAVSQYYGVDHWVHIAAVYNNTNLKIYLNGTEIVSATIPNVSYNTTNTVGFASYQYSARNEIIDQCRVFDSALSSTSIQTLYNETSASAISNISFDIEGLYNGTPTNVNFLGMAFQPDFVWIKARNDTTNHALFDSVRGATKFLTSQTTGSEQTYTDTLTSFDSNGYTVSNSSAVNGNTVNYVAWCWKAGGAAVTNTNGTITSQVSANVDAGFSIVKYSGTTTNATIGHGLNEPLELYITKATDGTDAGSIGWYVYSKPTTATHFLALNSTNAASDNNLFWNDTEPTASVFSVANNGVTNGSGTNYIAYCFHSVDGYQKVGSYSGGSSGSGNIIETGFKPRYVMLKVTNVSGEDWHCFDSVRGGGDTFVNDLRPNTSEAESTFAPRQINFVDNGFYWTETEGGVNGSGRTYIYLAIA